MKHILIVGATSAIATACAREWARQGASFFLVARNTDKLLQTAADLTIRGAETVRTLVMDANSIEAHQTMLNTCVEAFGKIDIAFIAYGTLPDQVACENDPRLLLKEFANNCTSVIAMLTLLANQMESQRFGVLAVITSVAGDRGRQSNYLYGSAKAALTTFCSGLRGRLFKKGVHLIDIKPGFVATPMTQGLQLPEPLVAQSETVAKRIIAGIERKANVLYTPAFWALIMFIIRSLPEFMFKRMKL